MKKIIISVLVVVILLGSITLASDTHVPWEQDGAVLHQTPCLTLDPWQPTFLSAEQLDLLWPGMGKALHDLEVVWSINALFAVSVAQVESGKQNRWNNFFGIKAGSSQPQNNYGFRTWETAYDGILGFGHYIRTSGYYPVGSSIEEIAVTYCNSAWAYSVYAEMRYLVQRISDAF